MIIKEEKFKEIIYKTIIETARNCGRKLSIKDQNRIYLKVVDINNKNKR